MFLFVPAPGTQEHGASSAVPSQIQAAVEQPSPPCLPLLLSALGTWQPQRWPWLGASQGCVFLPSPGSPDQAAGSGFDSDGRRLNGRACPCMGWSCWPWHSHCSRGVLALARDASGSLRGLAPAWPVKEGVPALRGGHRINSFLRGTGTAWPRVPALCCYQAVNRHFAISALSPKHGNTS